MKRKTLVGIIGILLMCIIYKSLILNGVTAIDNIFTNKVALENTSYVVQIICGFSAVVGAIIGIWQYVLTSRSERRKISMERVEKAIELAEYYKNEILPKYEIIITVFDGGKVGDILSKIKLSDMKTFTSDELQRLLSPADIQALEKKMQSKEILNAIISSEMIFGFGINIDRYFNVSEDNGKMCINVEKPDAIRREFMSNVVSELLNAIEYFAMNFIHEVADESVVYQSLSKTYIEMIQLLYYNIAKNNTLDKPRLFTNATELYCNWYKKSENRDNYVINAANKINKGTVLSHELN